LPVYFVVSDIVWEGTAAMSRFGEFPVSGMYGASNSFPINTVILVNNTKNNKSVEIIIANTLKDNNLFLLLSKDAAEKIGLKDNEILNVKTSIIKTLTNDLAYSLSKEKPFSIDDTPGKLLVDSSPKDSEVEKDADAMAEDEKTDEIDIFDESTDDEIVEDLDITDEDEIIIEIEEEIVEDEIIDDAVIAEGETTDEEIVVIEEDETEESDIAFDDDSEAEDVETATDGKSGKKKYVVLPTDKRPPVVNGKSSSLLIDKTTLGNDYYVQIRAFKEYSAAENEIRKIPLDYPVLIYYDKNKKLYKVVAGPLAKDERGAALFSIKNLGYKDAFIKKGE
jgi:hypothetical protein